MARRVPWLAQLLDYERFSKGSKAHLRQTKHPNALPASWHCPGPHKGAVLRVCSPQRARFAVGQGCDCPSYVEAFWGQAAVSVKFLRACPGDPVGTENRDCRTAA